MVGRLRPVGSLPSLSLLLPVTLLWLAAETEHAVRPGAKDISPPDATSVWKELTVVQISHLPDLHVLEADRLCVDFES